MKKTLKLVLFFLSMIIYSNASYSEWTKISSESKDRSILYIDFERIKKIGDYTYWWELIDKNNNNSGVLSTQYYMQGDCKSFRRKVLKFIFHKQNMARDIGDEHPAPLKYGNWRSPVPNSNGEKGLEIVCKY